MKILIVGNGGREHALLWKLRRDEPAAKFFVTQGNGGTQDDAVPLPFTATEFQPLAGWAEQEGVDLTVVGPETPLAAGIVDHFSSRGLAIFGPTGAAAEIESSKVFAKRLMTQYGVPTAAFEVFTELGDAESFIRRKGAPLVVKASGLAAGKGAVVCRSVEEALAAAREMLGERVFGEAGAEIVIEEFMEGEELSVFALTDGKDVLTLLPSQDHKRVGEGDTGPNTGGMGAYAPVSIVTQELMKRVEDEILLPTLAGMEREGRAFRGLLYAGLMLTPEGPSVVEFNCRFGDPETQVVLPLLSSSLLEPIDRIARGERLAGLTTSWYPAAAVTTVVAAGGYPGRYSTGAEIHIPHSVAAAEDVIVFHAGTAVKDGRTVTAGGRVLNVTGLGSNVAAAAETSRAAAAQIRFEGAFFRSDIGWREVARSAGTI